MGKDLTKYQDTLLCGTCRNSLLQSSKVNVNQFGDDNDFVFVNCDDCQKRFEEHSQLTASFVICTCDKEPKELPLEMAGSEIKAKKEGKVEKSGIDKVTEGKPLEAEADTEKEAALDKKWDNAFKSKAK